MTMSNGRTTRDKKKQKQTNVDKKINICFTQESRDTERSFSLFIIINTITKLNLEHSDKF